MTSLAETIEAARNAVKGAKNLSTALPKQAPTKLTSKGLEGLSSAPSLVELATLPSKQQKPQQRVIVRDSGDSRALMLKQGPKSLYDLLRRVSRKVGQLRGYSHSVSQVVIHQSQELLALALGVTRMSVYRWGQELKAAGLVDIRAHKSTVSLRGQNAVRNDGTLYAVSLREGHTARLRYDDMKHSYRDLEADRQSGKTAFSVMLQSKTQKVLVGEDVIYSWAVSPANVSLTPVVSVDSNTLLDVVYSLPSLQILRPDLVTGQIRVFAEALARGLNDSHSVGFWFKTIQDALNASTAHLNTLAAQLSRLLADMREWEGLRNPAALFVARYST